jgi:hypothetical protein
VVSKPKLVNNGVTFIVTALSLWHPARAMLSSAKRAIVAVFVFRYGVMAQI